MSFPGLLAQPALSFPALEVRGLSRILVNMRNQAYALPLAPDSSESSPCNACSMLFRRTVSRSPSNSCCSLITASPSAQASWTVLCWLHGDNACRFADGLHARPDGRGYEAVEFRTPGACLRRRANHAGRGCSYHHEIDQNARQAPYF